MKYKDYDKVFYSFIVILITICVLVCKCVSVYIQWKILETSDISFWEYFWINLFNK